MGGGVLRSAACLETTASLIRCSAMSAEQRVPPDHPLRAIRALVDEVLRDMSREFDGLYAAVGRGRFCQVVEKSERVRIRL